MYCNEGGGPKTRHEEESIDNLGLVSTIYKRWISESPNQFNSSMPKDFTINFCIHIKI